MHLSQGQQEIKFFTLNRGAQTFCGGQSNQNAQQTNVYEFGNQRERGIFVPCGGRRGGCFEETSNVTIVVDMVTWQTNVFAT